MKVNSVFCTEYWKNMQEMYDLQAKAKTKMWEVTCSRRDWLIVEHPPGSQLDFGGVTMNVVFHSANATDFIVSMKVKYFDNTGALHEHTFTSDEFPLREWLKEMPKEGK